PVLSSGEYTEMVVRWNDTAATPSPASGVHELVVAQTGRSADSVAVSCGPDSLSYAALEDRANRLAHHLIAAGVGPESVVGIALERSTAMVVALLAIWKAGGAYLPLDPDYPARRLGYMVSDSGARIVISTRSVAARFDAGAATM